MELFHHKECDVSALNFIKKRTLENLILDNKIDEIKSIVNDPDTVTVCSTHFIKDHINSYYVSNLEGDIYEYYAD